MNSPGRRPAGRTKGFTLVELMIALVLMGTVVTFVLRFLFNIDRSWETSRDQLTNRQHERAGAELLIRDIRMAGSGFGGLPITTAGVPGNLIRALEPSPGVGTSDTLVITGGFSGSSTVTVQPMVTAADPIRVASIAGFDIGDLIVITNGVEADLFQVTATEAGTTTLQHAGESGYNNAAGHVNWPLGGYPAASTVVPVERVRWWVRNLDTGPRLMRQPVGGEAAPVADGLLGLRLRYEVAGGQLVADPPDTARIRSVVLSYVVPAAGHSDEDGEADTMTVRVSPRIVG